MLPAMHSSTSVVRTGELITRYFDTSKFVPNAIGTFGNSGKNTLQAPGFFKTDFGAIKNFTIR